MRRPKTDPAKASRLILQYEKELKQLIRQWETQVLKSLNYASGKRLLEAPIKDENILFESIAMISTAIIAAASGIVAQQVMKSYLKGDTYATTQIKRIDPDLTVGISFNLPAARETLNHLERRQNIAFTGLTDELNKQVHRQVSDGILSGESVYQIADRVKEVSNLGYTRCEAIARTETMTALNQGALDRYRQAGFNQVQWFAAEDERTCRRPLVFNGVTYAGCGGLDGKVFDINNYPPIPYHPNCRCSVIPATGRKLSAVPIAHIQVNPPRIAAEGDLWIPKEDS